ncbi:MAG: hypothetical protein F9K29_01095 [Hyphomicrobiaceae bacterium]|nr:MAG: hypothetical protein F9K29_01095 [Hyphomicrobiaceae bacterium]
MSLQDALTAPLFKRENDGRTIVFPMGVWGGGYVLPDDATEERMRRILMWLMVSSGLIGGIGSQVLARLFGSPASWDLVAWAVAAGALAVVGIGYWLLAARLVRGLAPTSDRLSLVEALKKQAEAMPGWYLRLAVIGALLMLAGSAYWAMAGATISNRLLGIGGIALFGVVTLQAVYGLARRAKM